MYTIELDNNEGRGEVILAEGTIKVIRPDGVVEDTGVRSTEASFGRDVLAIYGNSVWELEEGEEK